uniref:KK-42-binding protein n=1 Tax=Antheraea yamamai TaxID=7121 RepID=Q86M39_ANTYA|nr:KK-42-binding protein [Antheraea yamamai]
MKAVYILFFLALAHDISGSIFRHHTLQPDTLIVDSRDFISQYQQALYEEQQRPHLAFKRGKHHHSSSQENSKEHKSKSSESDDTSTYEQKYAKPTRSHSKNKKSPLYVSVTKVNNVMSPTYGEPIMWKDLELTNNQNTQVATTEDIKKIFGDAQTVMKHITEEDKTKFHEQVNAALQKNKEENLFTTVELLDKYQYPSEEHMAKTDDGYYLTIFRIPPKTPTEKVVLLMHGLMGSSDDWLLLGPQKSLAYQLADAGYDVWLGNVRGNRYSRHHVSKHPAIDEFWDYNNDDISQHDLPAIIDYILKVTGQDKLDYIGHSQGNTNAIALLAEQPWYGEKFNSFHALAPMVYMGYARSPMFRIMALNSPFHDAVNRQLGPGLFMPPKELVHSMGGALCEEEVGCRNVCANVNFVMSGVNIEELDPETVPTILTHVPAGTSTKVMKHYSQNVASQEFRKYDYGAEINEHVYGTPEPPSYDLKNVKVPIWLYYGEEDWLTHPKTSRS